MATRTALFRGNSQVRVRRRYDGRRYEVRRNVTYLSSLALRAQPYASARATSLTGRISALKPDSASLSSGGAASRRAVRSSASRSLFAPSGRAWGSPNKGPVDGGWR